MIKKIIIVSLIIFLVNYDNIKVINTLCNPNTNDRCDYGTTESLCNSKGCCFKDVFLGVGACFHPICIEGCQECVNSEKCEVCKSDYYLTEDTKICYNEVFGNYYIDGNILKRCPSNCLKCIKSESVYCTLCENNYYLTEDRQYCYKNDIDNYYLDNDILKRCHPNCLKCTNSENKNCISCQSNYYLTEDTKSCYNDGINNYYLYDNILKKCHYNCKTCISAFSEFNMNCILCKEEYHKLNGTNNCYKTLNDSFYFKEDKFYPCDRNCLTCSDGKNEFSNNCLSCDNENKGLYLVEDLNNCEYNNYSGYYLDNNINILKRCYNSCKICNGSFEINNYIKEENHNCLECAENYYKLPYNLYPNNCYDNEIIKSLKIKEDTSLNTFKTCYYTCKNCYEGPEINEIENIIINHNCIECIEGYNLKFETKNCYNDSILEKGYYLSSYDSMYHQCDIQCQTCSENITSNKSYCLSCNNELGYYSAENKSLSLCYNNITIDNHYFLEKYYDTNGFIINTKWTLCYSTCASCSAKGNSTFHNCNSCIQNHYFINGTKNCFTENYAKNIGHFLNIIDSKFYKCDNACSKCIKGYENNNTNCIDCNYEKGYYPIFEKESNNCFNNETIMGGYYLDMNEAIYSWKKCYERCESCKMQGNSNKMNCISCKTNLMNEKTSKPYYFKLTENGNCIEGCSNNLFLTILGDCVSVCPNGSYKYHINYTCLKSCPNNYVINKDQNECIIKTFDQTTSSSEFKNQIMNNISAFLDSSALINGSDFIAVIFTSEDMDPKEQLKKGISAVDLGDCTQAIKEYYNISKDESLIILNMESKKNDSKKQGEKDNNDNSFYLGKNVQVEVYDMSGRKLDLSVCKEDIKVMKYIGDVEELDIESAMGLADQGIDVFNASDSFFNDICQDYNNTDGKDLVIKDRRSDIYQNVSFCQKGCAYDGMNYELMTANCICDSSLLQSSIENKTEYSDKNREEEQSNFNTLTKSIIANLFDFNFDVFSCSNLVFNLKKLVYNIGFYCMALMFILQIIFFLIYISKKLQPIKYYMLIFNNQNSKSSHSFPPRKNNNHNSIIEILDSQNFDQNKNIKSEFFSGKKKENEKKLKHKEKINIIEEDNNNESDYNSKRKLRFMNDIGNLENIFERKNKDLENLNEFYSKIKPNKNKNIKNDRNNNIYSLKGKRKIIFTNNFSPTINIQTPVLNINSKKLK